MERSPVRTKATHATLTILRVTVGIVMTAHGWLKLTSLGQTIDGFAEMGMPVPDVMAYLATAGEFLGGLGLIVGLLTPVAAFGVASTMAVAILAVHLPHGLFAKNNGFEYPLVMLTAALYFMARGAGPVSLDALIRHKTVSLQKESGQPLRPREAREATG